MDSYDEVITSFHPFVSLILKERKSQEIIMEKLFYDR